MRKEVKDTIIEDLGQKLVEYPHFYLVDVAGLNAEAIAGNAKELISTIVKLKPAAAKGTYIKSIFISSTMSKGIKIDPKSAD